MDRVVVVDYDARWPGVFESLRKRLSEALGGLASAIEHVGSTAVPGLAAKPIIDLNVLMASESTLPEVIDRLGKLGYVYQGDLGIAGREAFRTSGNGPSHHLYVCPPHSAEFRRHTAFRDYLRMHPEIAKTYGDLKKELAARFPDDRAGYIAGKHEFVASLTERALVASRSAAHSLR